MVSHKSPSKAAEQQFGWCFCFHTLGEKGDKVAQQKKEKRNREKIKLEKAGNGKKKLPFDTAYIYYRDYKDFSILNANSTRSDNANIVFASSLKIVSLFVRVGDPL